MPSYKTDSTGMAVSQTFKAEATEVRAYAEAQVYSLLNPYLTDQQKAVVEVWFQMPGLIFFYGFIAAYWLKPHLLTRPVFAAIYLSLAAGIAVTKLGPKALHRLIPFASVGQLLPLALGVLLLTVFTKGLPWGSALGLLAVLLSPLNPGAMYASAWAVGRYPVMINKYAAAKRLFGVVLPFEKYLDDSERARNEAKARIMGTKIFGLIQVIILVLATIKWSLSSSI